MKTWAVIVGVSLVAAVIVAPGSTAVAQSQRFSDVSTDHYAFEAIEWAAEAGVTAGYNDGTFKPQRPLNKRHAVLFMESYYDQILQADQSNDFTRGDMMVLLKAINDGTLRGTGTPSGPASGPTGASQSQRFPDVSTDHYAFEAIEWAAEAGVTAGYNDGTFKPQRPLNKRHAVLFMESYYDQILQADQSNDFTRGDMMVLLKAINDGTLRAPPTAVESAVEGTRSAISISETHGCKLSTDGQLACWGDNTYGQASPPSGEFIAVAVGHWYSCALRTDGTIACWGDNLDGRTDAPEGTYTDLAAAPRHPCALHTDATIVCWGRGHTAYPGGQVTYRPPHGTFTDISLSDDLGCAVRTDGSIACWGWVAWLNRNGTTPTGRFVAVDTHPRTHVCALRSDHSITCWGASEGNALDAPAGPHLSVVTGRRHSCALKPDRSITCWGDRDDPQRVGGAHAVRSYGLANPPGGQFRAIAATDWQTCALRHDDTHTCWGHDAFVWGTDPWGTAIEPPPTESEPLSGEILRQYIKANIIDQYSTAHPWLLEAWEFIDRPDFQYAIGRGHGTGTRWDERRPWRPDGSTDFSETGNRHDFELTYSIAAGLSIPDATYLSEDHDSFYIMELARIYVESAHVRSDPVPLALAHLHFNKHRNLWEGQIDCTPARLIEETLVHIVLPNESLTQWASCPSLPDAPDQESLAIIKDALRGQIPAFLSVEFTAPDGTLDHARIWHCLVYYHCERYSAQLIGGTSLLYQLRNAFGGYCSNAHVSGSYRFDLELHTEHPWEIGGCEDPRPTMTTGLKTGSNVASRAVMAVVEEFRGSNPWIQTAWELTNKPEYQYIPVARPYGQLTCSRAHNCVQPGWRMTVTVGEYENTHARVDIIESNNPPTEPLILKSSIVSTVAHELAHDYTMIPHDILQAPAIAIGWLYFRSLSSTLGPDFDYSGWEYWCLPHELYAQAAETLITVQPPYRWTPAVFYFCTALRSHSEQALSVARDSLNGTLPAWFYEEFGLPDGRIDYVALWQKVVEFPSYPIVPQLANAFGGYCFSIEEIRSALQRGVDLPGGADQPWMDGGCPN